MIENEKALAKAGDDPKKRRKVVRKKPPEGFVAWGEPTFERLVAAEPEPLTSSFRVTHAMLLNVIDRPGDGWRKASILPRNRPSLILAISVHASGYLPYSIPGARICATILTCIAWFLPVDSLLIIPVGSPADPASSCRCAYSAACSGARCWLSSSRLIRKENSVALAL